MTVDQSDRPPLARAPGVVDRLARRLIMRKFAAVRGGEITICDATGSSRLGEAGVLQTTVRVHHPRFYRRVALGASLAAATAYVHGDWDCDDLTTLFRLLIRNAPTADSLDRGWSRAAYRLHRLAHRWRGNSRAGSLRNIAAHYDLGNDFFQLWLDDTWAYSCGIFSSSAATLRDASIEKFDRVCRKLDLQPSDHLLEIGAGWGGLAIHAAQRYGCRVTATTISRQQFDMAQQRIASAGLSDRITLLAQDYRDLTGRFDKLASIEMVEAVGHEYLDAFFHKCGELLNPQGSMLLQAIVMPERGYNEYLRSVDFIRRYIFPGGCLPSVASLLESAGRTTRLRFVHAEEFGLHYAETLENWRENFHARREDVGKLAYSREMVRLWEFYLCYCQAAFEERHVGVVQMQFDNFLNRSDPVAVGGRAALWSDPWASTAATKSIVRLFPV
jgi:cyclopropane-fatty-acyl-phospholipid synthase